MAVVQTVPYPQAEDILTTARVICNDAALSIAGDILSDNQPYTFPLLQSCYEKLQDRLIADGVNTYNTYATIIGLGASTQTDPGIQMQLSYTGYFDGTTENASPTLPGNFLMPLEFWERLSGSQNAWQPMLQASDSISFRPMVPSFGIWDWQGDVLYLPPATQINDLKAKYILYAPALTTPTSPVLVGRCKEALAQLVAERAVRARGGTEAANGIALGAERAIKQIVARYGRKEQYAHFARRPFRSTRAARGRSVS